MSATSVILPRAFHRLRERAYDAIYVSPHLDDAVYSCAGQMALARARGARILVVTLFGNGSDDESGGGVFGNYAERKREEQRAAAVPDTDYLFLNAPDALSRKAASADLLRYAVAFMRLPERPLRRELRALLEALVDRLLSPEGRVYVPLAIGEHPDHREAYEIGRVLHARDPGRVLFYEDVPYTHVPTLRAQRLRHLQVSAETAGHFAAQARELTDFALAPQSPVVRWLATPLALLHLVGIEALFRLAGSADDLGGRLRVEEHDVGSVLETKVSAMLAYATQTAFFYPTRDALYRALREHDDRYLERVWTLAPDASDAAGAPPRIAPDQSGVRIDALLRAPA